MMHPDLSALADAEHRKQLLDEAERSRQAAYVQRSRRLARATELRAARRRRLRRLVTRVS
ncbi:MAG: hypothetical protein GEV11_16585 [Streptosporangiales bacterium]|nr:hypothetical protein [Streptosporangiales bacterium]